MRCLALAVAALSLAVISRPTRPAPAVAIPTCVNVAAIYFMGQEVTPPLQECLPTA